MLDVHMLARLAIAARDERDAAYGAVGKGMDAYGAVLGKLRALRAAVSMFAAASSQVIAKPVNDRALAEWTVAMAALDPLMEDD